MIHNNYTMLVVSGSKVWQYFCKEISSESATCKKCKVKMCKLFYTTKEPKRFLRHLKNAYKELNLDMKHPHEDTVSEIGNVQRKMMMFVKQQAVEEIVSKLATVDGFSINAITKSEFIRKFV